jgi:hypothetical protein
VLVHACNPSYSGDRDKEDCNSRSALAKSLQDPISTNKKLHVVTHVCHSSYAGSISRRIMAQVRTGIK